MYTILKPEARKHIVTIEETLAENRFEVISRHYVRDWAGLAFQLYAPQINTDQTFASEFNCYLWLTDHFFGNSAAVLLLGKEGELDDNLVDLANIKHKIRQRINGDDGIIRIFLNIDKLDPDKRNGIGIRGNLGIEREGAIESARQGRWDNFYFKYIHVPDPSLEVYERELCVLRETGILDTKLLPQEWERMKYMQTLVYPEINVFGGKQ